MILESGEQAVESTGLEALDSGGSLNKLGNLRLSSEELQEGYHVRDSEAQPKPQLGRRGYRFGNRLLRDFGRFFARGIQRIPCYLQIEQVELLVHEVGHHCLQRPVELENLPCQT